MKLQYKDLHLKTKRAFTTKFFKENNITLENIGEEKLIALNTVLGKDITGDQRVAFYQILISETTLEKDLVKRFERYEKLSINKSFNTEEFFRIKLGDELGIKTFLENKEKRSFGNTLKGQIKKYGKEEGARRYNEMNSKRAHTLDNFIRIHGETKGREMYKSTMSKKGLSLEKLQNKYGKEEGLIRWNEWKSKCISTEKNFIRRHGEKAGKQKWQDFKDKSKSTKENFIRRHGKVEGEKRWKNYKENYGWTQASQQSLEIFEPLTKQLLEKGIDFNDIFYGVENSFEFKIEKGEKLYSYDYTILPLKLIFEFNGSHVHPSKEKLGEAWNTWKNAWTGEDADTKYAQDQHKIKIAEKEGFTVLEIWDYEDRNESLNKCLRLVEERI